MQRAAKREQGSSAVEFALVLPVLITLLLGIIEFGFFFNQQISVTQAAREGARAYAIEHSDAEFSLNDVVQNAAPSVPGITAKADTTGCPVNTNVTITASKKYISITGWIDFTMPATVQAKAAMRCGG
ncbi:pilus assembly protein [Paeniglutamicibacter sp. ZC-3]|uniref:TadE/TadG family type IV pilus assembly protein n=1 Tax=Paeniglutamicibacter sp. ZC-3 TaxID=2986919 RepID=UPI0021F7DB6B|nr:TadE/TadG family type IV pilus assembly protein [Paeniglutamicibacter sp. ZC-3]MCV9992998.1 pilus assembly protein [Paeniglutamicibacter sp. ZC-3]